MAFLSMRFPEDTSSISCLCVLQRFAPSTGRKPCSLLLNTKNEMFHWNSKLCQNSAEPIWFCRFACDDVLGYDLSSSSGHFRLAGFHWPISRGVLSLLLAKKKKRASKGKRPLLQESSTGQWFSCVSYGKKVIVFLKNYAHHVAQASNLLMPQASCDIINVTRKKDKVSDTLGSLT